ncbi:hypothetical protein A3A39_03775 [Candidatus Kaiserbacteria bacterium RIFCSPLOWO2_01_FULL_54_13]|uniref:Uncharacterized protein n=1 Tax=Candidatus Kaiserbacteria bacterium RIFCSPLOWO2_01_FULL_54_13 TaxID=1798512 RepID=A0A1F6F210_9BACT|nr:MAG: hypothetical protein A3A39_03775 [Candidatus Kaiserbacteria bacterium RIFCSPLOWO2_01_FULL_54_13]
MFEQIISSVPEEVKRIGAIGLILVLIVGTLIAKAAWMKAWQGDVYISREKIVFEDKGRFFALHGFRRILRLISASLFFIVGFFLLWIGEIFTGIGAFFLGTVLFLTPWMTKDIR